MIWPCIRCGKELDTPDDRNADYIAADDTVVREPVQVFIALVHNRDTLTKVAEMVEIDDSEYDEVEVFDVFDAKERFGDSLVKVIVEMREKDIQKYGIICPDCYKPTDTLIWGFHKK